jgi:K+-sensing histidine kinase KdpD
MSFSAETQSNSRRLAAYAVTVPAVGAGLLTGLLFVRADAPQFSITPLALVVALCAWYGGLGAGLFALLQCALAIDFFLLGPGSFLQFSTAGQALAFFAFIVGWLGFCILADRVVRQMHRDRLRRIAAEAASSQAQRLTQLTAALAHARTPRSAIEAIVQESLHALKADVGMLPVSIHI